MATPSAQTPEYGFPYPLESDVPDIPTCMQMQMQAIENLLKSMRIGTITMVATSSAPTGALLCQGQAVSRTTYATLFAKIGTAFGAGNGSTTFNIPDLRGRAPIGAGHATGLSTRTLGANGGAETVTLDITQIPAHDHTPTPHHHTFTKLSSPGGSTTTGAVQTSSGLKQNTHNTSTTTASLSSNGGGESHSNMQPFVVVNFAIYYE